MVINAEVKRVKRVKRVSQTSAPRSERRSARKNSLTEPPLLEMSGNATYQELFLISDESRVIMENSYICGNCFGIAIGWCAIAATAARSAAL